MIYVFNTTHTKVLQHYLSSKICATIPDSMRSFIYHRSAFCIYFL